MNEEKEALLHLINSHTLLMNNIRSEENFEAVRDMQMSLVRLIVVLELDEMAVVKTIVPNKWDNYQTIDQRLATMMMLMSGLYESIMVEHGDGAENYLGMLFYHGELLVKQIVHLRMFDDEMALMKEN